MSFCIRSFIVCFLVFAVSFSLGKMAIAQESSAVFSGGPIIVGYDNRACTAELEGAIRYHSNAAGTCSLSAASTSQQDDHDNGDNTGYMLIDGDKLYVQSNFDWLNVYDISDLRNITELGDYNDGVNAYIDNAAWPSISDDGSYLFIASQDSDRLLVLDVSDPASITVAANFTHATYLNDAHTSVVVGDTLFVNGWSGRLTAYDIADPATLSDADRLGSIDTGFNNGMMKYRASDGYLFIASIEDGIQSVDVSDPASMTTGQLLTLHDRRHDVIDIIGNYAYVGTRSTDHFVTVVDITNPTGMVEKDSTALGDVTDVVGLDAIGYASNRYVIATSAGDTDWAFIDVSDPDNISIVDRLSSAWLTEAETVVIDGNRLVVGGWDNGRFSTYDLGCNAGVSPAAIQFCSGGTEWSDAVSP